MCKFIVFAFFYLYIRCKTRLKYLNLMDILAVFKTMNFIWLEIAQSSPLVWLLFILCSEIKYKAMQDLLKQDMFW